MSDDLENAYKQLKKDYYDMERVNREEKECLIRVIHAFGTIVAMHGETAEGLKAIRGLLDADTALPVDQIDTEVVKFKDEIIKMESEPASDEGLLQQIHHLKGRLDDSCRLLNHVTLALTEDFYPLSDDLLAAATSIQLDCQEEIEKNRLPAVVKECLGFIDGLKSKISEDFKYINNTFITLLNQVKELESAMAKDFAGNENLKKIEYFEMKINNEVGSIVKSFNIHQTIDEIKSTVIEKIKNIKRLVSAKKKEETLRTKKARENIKKLNRRIKDAEKNALEMSKKAEQFQIAAMEDGLTGLYNRKAFDLRVKEALTAFYENREAFSVVIFDVDKFKEINDNFGHVAGDKVLIKVAQCMHETFRKNDFIARYGGDEFAVVIEGLTRELANERIFNFRENLKKRRFTSYAKGDVQISVSTGIAIAQEGDTIESLIERADQVMYAAKEAGKSKDSGP